MLRTTSWVSGGRGVSPEGTGELGVTLLGLLGTGRESFLLVEGKKVSLPRFSFGAQEIDQTTSTRTSQKKDGEGAVLGHDLSVLLGFKLHALP